MSAAEEEPKPYESLPLAQQVFKDEYWGDIGVGKYSKHTGSAYYLPRAIEKVAYKVLHQTLQDVIEDGEPPTMSLSSGEFGDRLNEGSVVVYDVEYLVRSRRF